MLSAKEARETALSNALKVIQEQILHASKQGKTWFSYYGIISQEDQNTLKNLGYTVDMCGSSAYNIFW